MITPAPAPLKGQLLERVQNAGTRGQARSGRGLLPIQEREQLVVEQPIRRDNLLLRPRWAPVERAHPSPRLLHDRHQRRVVPGGDARVDGSVDRPFGDERVLPAETRHAERVGEVRKLERESEVGGRHPPRLLRYGTSAP